MEHVKLREKIGYGAFLASKWFSADVMAANYLQLYFNKK